MSDLRDKLCFGFWSLGGIAIVLLRTEQFGPGLSTDSIHYIACAKNLIAGNGFYHYDGSPYVNWPPLFPFILAILNLLGFDLLQGIRYFHATCFGGLILALGYFLSRNIKSKILLNIGLAYFVFSQRIIHYFLLVYSEPLFFLLTTLFFLFLPRYLEKEDLPTLLCISTLASLACLQRYAGFPLILSGCLIIVLIFSSRSILKGLKSGSFFIFISFFLPLIWLYRKYRITSSVTLHGTYNEGFFSILSTVWRITFREFFPFDITFSHSISLGFLLLFVIILIFIYIRKIYSKSYTRSVEIWSVGVFILIYLSFFVAMAFYFQIPLYGDRYLVTIFIFWSLLGFVGADKLLRRVPQFLYMKPLLLIGLVLFLFNFPSDIETFYFFSKENWTRGVSGYGMDFWAESPTMRSLRERELSGNIYSNAPDGLYVHTGIAAHFSPIRKESISKFKNRMDSREDNFLVWIQNRETVGWKNQYLDLDELDREFEMKEIQTFADGKIFRFWSKELE
jgi:hypothetical protein